MIKIALGLSSRHLIVYAALAWLASLFLTVFTDYRTDADPIRGYEILLLGWMALPLFTTQFACLAWLANVFFLYGLARVLGRRPAWVSCILASVLSLDTIRFDELPLNAAIATSPVYGYGWGAVLWFFAMFLLLTATGTEEREASRSSDRRDGYLEGLQPLGIALCIITVICSSYFALHDRIVANAYESERLAGIAFKRGEVCAAPDPVVRKPLDTFRRPLEVVLHPSAAEPVYPFKLARLLEWEIGTVRMDGFDFWYRRDGQERLIVSVPARGEPAAVLHVEGADFSSITARLVEVESSRTVFEQTWKRQEGVDGYYYCPSFRSFPALGEQPRKVVMEGLGLSGRPATDKPPRRPTISRRVEGIIVTAGKGEPLERKLNSGCPYNIGWKRSRGNHRHHLGLPFVVDQTAYYRRSSSRVNYATCIGAEAAYLYSGSAGRGGVYRLNVEKRQLPGFHQEWAEIITIKDVPFAVRDDLLMIQWVREQSNGVLMKLVHRDSGQFLVVKAAFELRE